MMSTTHLASPKGHSHLKIVVLSLVLAIIVAGIGIAQRVSEPAPAYELAADPAIPTLVTGDPGSRQCFPREYFKDGRLLCCNTGYDNPRLRWLDKDTVQARCSPVATTGQRN